MGPLTENMQKVGFQPEFLSGKMADMIISAGREEKLRYTLITGASRGLGKAMATECASRGRNLILVSLPGEGISNISDEIKQKYSVETASFETDLRSVWAIRELISQVTSSFEIDMLINNAGIGGTMRFADTDPSLIDDIILVNMRAMALLTRGLLPVLLRQPQAWILNIASMASFGPMPYKTVYPASKAFVYSFSRGLFSELRGTRVFVSVAHPGGMVTSPVIAERIKDYNWLIRSTIMSPEKIAAICIRQLLKKDSLIIPGAMNMVSYLLIKLCPVWLRLRIFEKTLIREIISSRHGQRQKKNVQLCTGY